MPTYTLRDIKNNHEWEVICSWDELQTTLDELPNVIQVPSAPKIVSGVKGLNSHIPSGFKDVLDRVKSGAAKDNKINTHR